MYCKLDAGDDVLGVGDVDRVMNVGAEDAVCASWLEGLAATVCEEGGYDRGRVRVAFV